MEKKSIIDFLLGSESYDGYWWDDKPKDKRPPFWWRTKLREEIQSLREQLKEKEETINWYREGIARGDELYAHLKFDDKPFTPYQLALQKVEGLEEENAKLREALNKMGPSDKYIDGISRKYGA